MTNLSSLQKPCDFTTRKGQNCGKDRLILGFYLDNAKVFEVTESGSQSPAGLHIVQLLGQL